MVDIFILIVLLIGLLLGLKRGFINEIFALLGGFVALILALATYKPVAAYIVPLTGLDVKAQTYIEDSFDKMKDDRRTETTTLFENLTGADVVINQARESTVNRFTNFVINMLTLGFLMLFYSLLMTILKHILNSFAELPILDIANKVGGAILGLIQSVLVILFIFAGIYFASTAGILTGVADSIQESKVGSKIYNHNAIIRLLTKGNIDTFRGKVKEQTGIIEEKTDKILKENINKE